MRYAWIRGTRPGDRGPVWLGRIPSHLRRSVEEGRLSVSRVSAICLYAVFAPLALLVELGFGGVSARPALAAAAIALLILQVAAAGLARSVPAWGWRVMVFAIAVTYVLFGQINHAAGSSLAILLVVPVGWVAAFRSTRAIVFTVVAVCIASATLLGSTPTVSTAESLLVWLTRVLVYVTVAVTVHVLVTTLRRSRNEAVRRANTDAVTGASSRSHMVELLRAGFGGESAVLLFDIDHFKRVNDAHGHSAGDQALQAVVARAQRMLRSHDVLARWGGEEFLILAEGIGSEEALMGFAERIRHGIERAPFAVGGARLNLTVSVGCARIPAGRHRVRDVIAAADGALYEAKREGRNRARTATLPPPVPAEIARLQAS